MIIKKHWLGLILVVAVCAGGVLPTSYAQTGDPRQTIESDNPLVGQVGEWVNQAFPQASGGSYLYNAPGDAALSFEFSGTSVEVIYVAGPGLGTLAIEIDGTVLRTVITMAEQTAYQQSAKIDYLTDEAHTVKVYAQAGGVVGIDAFRVERLAEIESTPPAETSVVAPQDLGPGTWTATYISNFPTASTCIIPQLDDDPLPAGAVNRGTEVVSGSSIAFNWSGGAPPMLQSIGITDRFGIIFRRTVTFAQDTSYTIYYEVDDGFRLYDNGVLVVNDWDCNNGTPQAVNYTFAAGTHNLELHYVDISGHAQAIVTFNQAGVYAETRNQTEIRVVPSPIEIEESEYTIERSPNGTDGWVQIATIPTTQGSYTDSGLLCGTTYYYRLRVYFTETQTFSAYSLVASASTSLCSWTATYIRNFPTTNTCTIPDLDDDPVPVGAENMGTETLAGNDISFDWAESAPAQILPSTDRFGVIFRRTMHFTHDAPFQISYWVDDGFRFYDNGVLIHNDWECNAAGSPIMFAHTFTAGTHDIEIHYVDVAGSARIGVTLVGISTLTATALDTNRMRLNWTDPHANETEYRIERSPNGNGVWTEIGITPANLTTFFDTNLTCLTLYHYRVRAYFTATATYSPYSEVAGAITSPCPWTATYIRNFPTTNTCSIPDLDDSPPPAGATIVGTEQVNDIDFDWGFDGAPAPVLPQTDRFGVIFRRTVVFAEPTTLNIFYWVDDGFRIYDNGLLIHSDWGCNSAGSPEQVPPAAATFTAGTHNLEIHYVEVSGSARIAVTFEARSSLSATALNDGQIQLNWTDPQSNETEYRVERSLNGVTGWAPIATLPANTTSFTNVSLLCNTTYHYRVRAYNTTAGTFSPYSNPANATTAPCPVSCPAVTEIQRVSVAANGAEGNERSTGIDLSEDGRYATFTSWASNLVANDTNGVGDIFVRDQLTCQVWLVSVATNGAQGNGNSTISSISSDGRYVAFQSGANNLDVHNLGGVFVHDRQTGQTARVSVASDGSADWGYNAHISADGRIVLFVSSSDTLVPNNPHDEDSVFYHNRITGETVRVGPIDGYGALMGSSYHFGLSADGRYITYYSYIANIVPQDTNTNHDIFVYDRITAQTTIVSINSSGELGNFDSVLPSISGDGRYVTFNSYASNLVANDTNSWGDIFVHDRQTGQTTRVSVNSSGAQDAGPSELARISSDGRYVVFNYAGRTLTAGDDYECDGFVAPRSCPDVYGHDRYTGQTVRLSLSATGVQPNDRVLWSNISGDGRFAVFQSGADNLVSGDANGFSDVFIVPTHIPAITLNAPTNLTATVLSNSQIRLNWADNTPNETEYRVERSLNSGGGWVEVGTVSANTTTFTNANLACGTTYYYRVRAYRNLGTLYSSYSNVAPAATASCVSDTLALFNPATHTANLVESLTDQPPATDYVYYTTGFPQGVGGQYVMGDWDGDGLKTMGVYRNGSFWYTNHYGQSGSWTGIWIGLNGQAIAGRFNAGVGHDCIGATDSGTWTNGDTYYALYFTCNLTSGPTPSLTSQWLSIPLGTSGGFSGTPHFESGDFDGDGLDSVAVRRGAYITWTNIAPSQGHALFNNAQYFGAPGSGSEGDLVVGDWDSNHVDSFGLVYQNGTFYRRNDLGWNSGAYILQRFSPLVATPFTATTWQVR